MTMQDWYIPTVKQLMVVHNGKSATHHPHGLHLSLQDDGATLKVFDGRLWEAPVGGPQDYSRVTRLEVRAAGVNEGHWDATEVSAQLAANGSSLVLRFRTTGEDVISPFGAFFGAPEDEETVWYQHGGPGPLQEPLEGYEELRWVLVRRNKVTGRLLQVDAYSHALEGGQGQRVPLKYFPQEDVLRQRLAQRLGAAELPS